MTNINLSDKDNNTTITATVGDILTIALPINASTGYLWQARDTSAGHLNQVKHLPNNDGKIGGVATVQFIFGVQQAGHITLSYARPWSELQPPTKWYDIQVDIK